MNPSILRTLSVVAGIGTILVGCFVVNDPALITAGVGMLTTGGVTIHDAGHVTLLGYDIYITKQKADPAP